MKFALFILLLSSSLFAFPQTIKFSVVNDQKALQHTINWAMREKTEYSDGDGFIRIENTGNNLFQLGYTARLSTSKHGIILHKFDASGTEIMTNKLEDGRRVFGPIHAQSAEFRNRIFLAYFRYDDKDSMRLYISEINKKTLQLDNEQFLYSYQQNNVGILKMTRALKHELFMRISSDSSKLLLAYQDTKGALVTAIFGDQANLLGTHVSKNNVLLENDVTDAFVENSGNNEFVVSLANSSFSTVPLKGIIIQRLDNKEKYQEFGTPEAEGALLNCHIQNSKDNSRIYIFGDYAGAIGSAGSWQAEIESQNLKTGKPSLFPYPDDLKERVYKIGFGEKKHGNYGILDIDYELVEFDNGSLALCGNPVLRQDNQYVTYGSQGSSGTTHGYVMYYAGPVMAAFFDKGMVGKTYAMIPRNENLSQGSSGIYLPYHDKLLVFYNDYKKNINGEILDKDVHQSGGAITHELSLAYAVISKTGTILERKLISEGVSRMNCFDTQQYRMSADRTLFIPSTSIDKKSDAYKVAVITVE